MKIVAILLIVSVLVLFFTIPIGLVGGIGQSAADGTAESLDKIDGSNDFTSGDITQSVGSKIIDAFDGSGKN